MVAVIFLLLVMCTLFDKIITNKVNETFLRILIESGIPVSEVLTQSPRMFEIRITHSDWVCRSVNGDCCFSELNFPPKLFLLIFHH